MNKINNPFESGHIKNYILLYVSVVVIMILFFIASTLFNEVEIVETKVFEVDAKEKIEDRRVKSIEEKTQSSSLKSKLKLMDKSY